MNSDIIVDSTSQAKASVPASLPMPDSERLFTSLQQQVEQLDRQRAKLAETIQKLESELAAQRESLTQLQEDRDKYKELARMYLEMADPIESAISDFENMPPLDQLPRAEDLLEELEAIP